MYLVLLSVDANYCVMTVNADRFISTSRAAFTVHRRFCWVCRMTLPSTCGVLDAYWWKCILANHYLLAPMRYVDEAQ